MLFFINFNALYLVYKLTAAAAEAVVVEVVLIVTKDEMNT